MQEKFLLMANTISHTKVQNKSRTNVQKQKRNDIFIHFCYIFIKIGHFFITFRHSSRLLIINKGNDI